MSSENAPSAENDPRMHLVTLLKDLHTVMITTRSATDVMHARPSREGRTTAADIGVGRCFLSFA